MVNYNENPKNLKTGDCVIRAIALATNQTWDKVFSDLCEIAFKKKRMPNDKLVYEDYLKKLGWEKQKQPRSVYYENGYKSTYSKYTVNEFVDNLNLEKYVQVKYDAYIVTVANHMTSILFKDGKFDIYDIWDCGKKSIGNYWIKG